MQTLKILLKNLRLFKGNISTLNRDGKELDQSLKVGQKKPIDVWEYEKGKYGILDGQRRYRSAKRIGLKSLLAVVHNEIKNETEARLWCFSEFTSRKDASIYDKVLLIEKMYKHWRTGKEKQAYPNHVNTSFKEFCRDHPEIDIGKWEQIRRLRKVNPEILKKEDLRHGVARLRVLRRLSSIEKKEQLKLWKATQYKKAEEALREIDNLLKEEKKVETIKEMKEEGYTTPQTKILPSEESPKSPTVIKTPKGSNPQPSNKVTCPECSTVFKVNERGVAIILKRKKEKKGRDEEGIQWS